MQLNKTYKLDRIAGPSAIFSGYLLMLTGLVTIYFSYSSAFLILLGAALVFSFNAVSVNTTDGYFRPHLRLFGFLKIGERKEIPKNAEILLQKFTGSYATSSLSNRITKSGVTDYRIYMQIQKKKILVAKFNDVEEAQKEIEILKEAFK